MDKVDFLLVEDSVSDAHMIERIIQKQSIVEKYRWLKDGAEAIDFLEQEEVSSVCFVLLDIKLPKVSGLEVLKRVRSNEKTRYLPIVMYSSSEEEQDIKSAYLNGANSYITKPINFGDLKSTLKQLTTYWLKINKTL